MNPSLSYKKLINFETAFLWEGWLKQMSRLCQKHSKTVQICQPSLIPVLVHTDSIIMWTWRWDSHVANVEELWRRYPWPLMHFPSPAQLSWTTNILCVLYITEIWTHVFAFFIFTSTLQYTIRLHVLKKNIILSHCFLLFFKSKDS